MTLRRDDDGEPKPSIDEEMRALERRKAAGRRTAGVVAAGAIAVFVASLVQGHFIGIPNWVPPR